MLFWQFVVNNNETENDITPSVQLLFWNENHFLSNLSSPLSPRLSLSLSSSNLKMRLWFVWMPPITIVNRISAISSCRPHPGHVFASSASRYLAGSKNCCVNRCKWLYCMVRSVWMRMRMRTGAMPTANSSIRQVDVASGFARSPPRPAAALQMCITTISLDSVAPQRAVRGGFSINDRYAIWYTLSLPS